MRPGTLNYPANQDYGSGACRRMISVHVERGQAHAHLSDNFHEMRCAVEHDGRLITAIRGEVIRIPTTVCPGAVSLLQRFVGLPIRTPARGFYGSGRAAAHCTHLLDLAVIAIRHCRKLIGTTIYEATVPDETSNPVELEVCRNGAPVHVWSVQDGRIIAPAHLDGRTLDKGFGGWARDTFDDDQLEAATVLARTWLIAIGRHYRTAEAAGQPASINPQMFDRCYAYSMPQRAKAVFTGEPEHFAPF